MKEAAPRQSGVASWAYEMRMCFGRSAQRPAHLEAPSTQSLATLSGAEFALAVA